MAFLPRQLAAAWRPLAAVWLLTCLAGMLAGFWPDALVYPKTPTAAVPMPTLPALAVAQGLFLLIVYPLAILWRGRPALASRGRLGRDCLDNADETSATQEEFSPTQAAIELTVMLIAAAPFYITAACFSDAATTDVLRVVLCELSLIPLTIAACVWTQKKCGTCLSGRQVRNAECGISSPTTVGDADPATTIALLTMLLIALAMPAAVYICKEFLRSTWADALWNLSPLAFLWTNAHATTIFLPAPIATLIAWPLIGAAAIVARWMKK